MAPEKPEVEAELVENLEELGLNQYEAQTLVNLLRLGSGTAKDIARVGGVPRTRVYDAADALHELGLVDIQYSTPQKFTVVSQETLVRRLNLERESTIGEVASLLEDLEPTEPQREELGVWTVTGQDAISQRVEEFIDESEDRVILMSVDELLGDDQLAALRDAAEERDVEVFIAGVTEVAEERIQTEVPSAQLFESLWGWAETPAGRLLVTDSKTALVSVRTNGDDGTEETAIWGRGARNSLVVVLRAIFTWRLESYDEVSGD